MIAGLAPSARTDGLSTQSTTSLERTQAVVQQLIEDCIPLACPDEEVAFYKSVLQDIAKKKQQQQRRRNS